MLSPRTSRCLVVRLDICPVPTSDRRAGHGPARMAVGQDAVRAGECIPVPTRTCPQAGDSIPM